MTTETAPALKTPQPATTPCALDDCPNTAKQGQRYCRKCGNRIDRLRRALSEGQR